MGGSGHWTDRCFSLRHKVQDLRDQGLLKPIDIKGAEQANKPNVTQNPLPPHGNGNNSVGPSSNQAGTECLTRLS